MMIRNIHELLSQPALSGITGRSKYSYVFSSVIHHYHDLNTIIVADVTGRSRFIYGSGASLLLDEGAGSGVDGFAVVILHQDVGGAVEGNKMLFA